MASQLIQFLQDTLADPRLRWVGTALEQVARLHVPDIILGGRSALLRADLNATWAQWFLESICDLEPFVHRDLGYAFLVKEVGPRVREIVGQVPDREYLALTSQISQLLDREVRRRRSIRRVPISREQKSLLWEHHGHNPRCWVCGHLFAEWAIERFLAAEAPQPAKLPAFVDFAKPSGLLIRDHSIEVDHVVPVARGGSNENNLRLICGWCNNVKGARQSLYDVDGIPLVFHHPRRGRLTVPRPFWVVRLLAAHPHCEWSGSGGCDHTSENSELTVCAWHPAGSMNPPNLRVTCPDHHPFGHERLVARDLLLQSKTTYRTQ